MPRDRRTLTPGQWENLGHILGDHLWDQERTHSLLQEYFHDCGIPVTRISTLADETFRRIEAGFARNTK